jgi:hypothetical protein
MTYAPMAAPTRARMVLNWMTTAEHQIEAAPVVCAFLADDGMYPWQEHWALWGVAVHRAHLRNLRRREATRARKQHKGRR